MMKKLFVFAALAAPLFFFSCAKEMEPVQDSASEEVPVAKIAFKASIESLESPTKADINASNNLVWADGDKIGIFVNDGSWGIKNQSFVLYGAGGSTTGAFEWDVDPAQDFTNPNAIVAYFPYGGDNNVSDDNHHFYIELPQHYGSDEVPTYTSGKMLTPLVAQVTRTGDEYDPISFKHAGAAIKVIINNLPAGAHSISLTANHPVYGYYNIDPANYTDGMVENSPGVNDGKTTSFLHFAPSDAERPFTFLFPVPLLPASSTLYFNIYDKNNARIWGAGAKTAGDVALGRGKVLAMPALSISEPYKDFDQISAWGICGTHNSWSGDTPMVTEVDGDVHIANDITFEANAEFKIRKDGDWAKGEYGWSNIDGTDGLADASGNIKVLNAGTYDIILNTSTHKVKVVLSDLDYPDAGTMPHHTSIKKATNLGATETANCYVITAPGNYKIPGVQGNSATNVGTIAGVELLWETFNNETTPEVNSIIAAVDYDEIEQYVYFKTPAVLQSGNALIAAKDASDNILWSWHIWVPSTALTDVGDLKVSSKYFMDRNLGALVATEAKDSEVDVQSLGMLYQWGRKDPFGGARALNSTSRAKAAGTVFGDPNRTSETSFDLAASYANPTMFANYDGWLDGVEEWNPGGNKSINDPCPPGYKVPDYSSSDVLWGDVGSATGFSASATYGWWKIGKHVFPLAGYAGSGNSMEHAYDRCRLLTNSMLDGYPQYAQAQYLYFSDPNWKHDNSTRKRYLASVRCVKIDGDVPASATTPASGFTLDGDMSEWSDGEAIANSGSIKEWKYGADASNLYFYFKIDKTDIKDDAGSYNWKRYIYIALDTDNSTSTGTTYSGAGLSFPGCDALATVYPFRGTVPDGETYPAGVEFVNGVDLQGETQSPIGTGTDSHVTAYGYISGDYGYLEIGVPRAAIGSPSNGKMKVQFSYSWNKTGAQLIEIK